MHSMLALLAAGLYFPTACQQHRETHERFSSRGEVPLLKRHHPGFYPRSLASSVFDPPTNNEVHYAPDFRQFRNVVPTNFINIDSRFTYPSRFYYESTLYMTGRPKNTFYAFPMPPDYYQPLSYNYPPQVFEPGGYSYNPLPSILEPPTHPEFFNRKQQGNNRQSYPRGGSYAPSFRDHQPPQVYEIHPLAPNYRPNPPLLSSTSRNIVRDDETSTRGTILHTNYQDSQNHTLNPNSPFYNTQNTNDFPQSVTTVSPPGNSAGGLFSPNGSIPVGRIFVPSLFDNRPTSPPSSTPLIFVASDSPNIIRGEIPSTSFPSNTLFPTTNPGYDVSEPPISTYVPNSDVSGQPLNALIPTSSPEPNIHPTEVTLEGLFTPRMFTPSSFEPVPPGRLPNLRSRQPNVVFEAPGHDHPR